MSNTPQGAEPPLAIVNRRLYARRPVPSLAYIDLSENNGGIILNISEGGLAVTSAAPVDIDGPARMRLQIPSSSDWLETSGEIAWISESKRKGGIRFVNLSEDARNRIRGWIVSEVSAIEVQSEGVGVHEQPWRRLEKPTIGMHQSIAPQPANPDRATQVPAQVSTPTPNAAPTLFGARTSVAAPTSVILSPSSREGTEYKPGVKAGDGTRRVLVWRRSWVTLAVVATLVSFIPFCIGLFMAEVSTRSGILGRFGKTKLETSETANVVESSPASSVASVPIPSVQNASPQGDEPEPVSSSTARDLASRPANNARTEASSNKIAAASTVANVISSSSRVAQSHEDVLAPGPVSANVNVVGPPTRNAPPQGLGSVAAQTQETSVTTTPSPNVNQPEGARAAGTADRVSSPPSQSAENPAVVNASVSVSFGPYPSIRVPAGFRSQTSKQGASLQIGQLLSRVDPVYPEDAKTQRIEGTVKLHAVIGPDGTIESVAPRSGPALLIPGAANAVRQWRYTPSSVGSQRVEAEEDITITFRLPGQATHPN